MKVLRKVCPQCGYVLFFSVAVLCRPGTDADIGRSCPCCERVLGPSFDATEIDMEEVTADPDVETIKSALAGLYARTGVLRR